MKLLGRTFNMRLSQENEGPFQADHLPVEALRITVKIHEVTSSYINVSIPQQPKY